MSSPTQKAVREVLNVSKVYLDKKLTARRDNKCRSVSYVHFMRPSLEFTSEKYCNFAFHVAFPFLAECAG